jgi:5-methylcytosine-specific restriction endonuclease McrA
VAHPQHNQVRARWGARCGYCGVADEDVGGELAVDHYVPLVAGRDDSDDNLIYACFR